MKLSLAAHTGLLARLAESRSNLDFALRAGSRLLEAKDCIDPRNWRTWVQRGVGLDYQRALTFMRITRRFGNLAADQQAAIRAMPLPRAIAAIDAAYREVAHG